jgi:hypothetical protein
MSEEQNSEKQKFLHESIINAHYDGQKFIEYLEESRGILYILIIIEDGSDLDNWSMDELKQEVEKFIKLQQSNIAKEVLVNPTPAVKTKDISKKATNTSSHKSGHVSLI